MVDAGQWNGVECREEEGEEERGRERRGSGTRETHGVGALKRPALPEGNFI